MSEFLKHMLAMLLELLMVALCFTLWDYAAKDHCRTYQATAQQVSLNVADQWMCVRYLVAKEGLMCVDYAKVRHD